MQDPEGNELCVLRGPEDGWPGYRKREAGMNKVATMHDAVADLVRDGDTVAIEVHAPDLLRGRTRDHPAAKRDLTLARMTPDVIYDQMVGAGVAKKLIFSWLGNPGVGSLHAVRRRIEDRDPAPLEIEEYSHFGMVCRRGGRLEPALLPDPQLLRVRHPGGEREDRPDDVAVRRRLRGLRGPSSEADVTIVHAARRP